LVQVCETTCRMSSVHQLGRHGAAAAGGVAAQPEYIFS
jgi:hypothetical protein